MTQTDLILYAMLNNPQKELWYAKDFQKGKFFVGYEASARMSEIARLYFPMVITGQDGRYRTLSINWKKKRDIKHHIKRLNAIKEMLEKEN